MFRVKICGVTSVHDARMAVEAGADAIGLNFYPPSPRSVTADRAAAICAGIPKPTKRVGVFVDMPVREIQAIANRCGLDIIQLHGDESPATVQQLDERIIVRAFRCRDRGLHAVLDYFAECRDLGRMPEGALIDAYASGSYGGTGKVVDWTLVPGLAEQLSHIKIVLAGGLTAANVAESIRVAQPDAVDTATGVESEPGRKDPDLVRRFVESARKAFGLTGGQQLHTQ